MLWWRGVEGHAGNGLSGDVIPRAGIKSGRRHIFLRYTDAHAFALVASYPDLDGKAQVDTLMDVLELLDRLTGTPRSPRIINSTPREQPNHLFDLWAQATRRVNHWPARGKP